MEMNPWIDMMRCRAHLTCLQMRRNMNPTPWNDAALMRATTVYSDAIKLIGWPVVRESMETEDASLRRVRQLADRHQPHA